MKRNPRKKRRNLKKNIKTTNTGMKIMRCPRIAEVTGELYLSGESAERIATILKERYNFETTGQTVRAYLAKCFAVMSADDERRFREVMYRLLDSQTRAKQVYIKETATMIGFLGEALNRLNEECETLSKLQDYYKTTPQRAVAIAHLVKLMKEFRKDIEDYMIRFGTDKQMFLDKVFKEIVVFILDEVLPKVHKKYHNEIKSKLKRKLKMIKEQEVEADYKVV